MEPGFNVACVTLPTKHSHADFDLSKIFFFSPIFYQAVFAIPCKLCSRSFLFLANADGYEQLRFKVGAVVCFARHCPAACACEPWLLSFLLPPLTPDSNHVFSQTSLPLTGYFFLFWDCLLLTFQKLVMWFQKRKTADKLRFIYLLLARLGLG